MSYFYRLVELPLDKEGHVRRAVTPESIPMFDAEKKRPADKARNEQARALKKKAPALHERESDVFEKKENAFASEEIHKSNQKKKPTHLRIMCRQLPNSQRSQLRWRTGLWTQRQQKLAETATIQKHLRH